MGSILRQFRLVVMLWIPLVSAVALAHHHHPVYYSEKPLELEGELVSFQWRNPHPTWELRVINDAGEEELWNMEGAGLYLLQRAGVTGDLFRIGDRLKVTGLMSRREERVLLAHNMVLSDGRDFVLWGKLASRFNDAAKLVDAASEDRGIFRVWSTPAELFPGFEQQMRQLPLSETAIAGRDAWDPLDNYTLRCERPGMPGIMASSNPFEFLDSGDTITLRTIGIERTIHMDRSMAPEDAPWSRLGYSVGAWGGETLVVTTTHINWPYFDDVGTPQTEALKVVEKFTLSADQTRLNRDITLTDPETFTGPANVQGYWLALGEAVPPYDCQYTGRPGD